MEGKKCSGDSAPYTPKYTPLNKILDMKFFVTILASLVCFSSLVLTSSPEFELVLDAPDTILSDASIYVGDDLKIYIANDTEPASGYIANNGSLMIENYAVGIGKNYLSLTGFSSSFEPAVPWSIEDGLLKLYDNDFHAVPSGMDGIYVIGNANAHSGQDDVIPIGIKAVEVDSSTTTTLAAYTASSIGSTISFEVIDSSQTFDTSSNGAKALTVSFSYIIMTLISCLL